MLSMCKQTCLLLDTLKGCSLIMSGDFACEEWMDTFKKEIDSSPEWLQI